ncbi:MAG: hypothetical protein CO022_00845 [Flavobacteriales bacterium CG_4_9_14_0_2_um_filter_32_27]|nr:MAG: hypothetical protein CO022_00845 [Flavobacteriales bacterium CG_4_9_14_0_2_um_filter_32_27]
MPSIYTQISTGQELSINALPEYNFDKLVTIYTNIPANGTYTLDVEEIFPLTNNYKVSLTSISSNTHYRIIGDTSIVFSFNQQQGTPTFTFNISTPLVVTSIDESCISNNSGEVTLTKQGNTNWMYEILDQNSTIVVANTSSTDTINYSGLAPDTYLAKTTSNGIIDEVYFTIQAAPIVIADFDIDNDTIYLSEGGIINTTNQSQNATTYFWDFGNGGNSTAVDPSYVYSTIGDYNIVLNSSNNNCTEQTSKSITVLTSPSVVTSVQHHAFENVKLQNFGNGKYQITSPYAVLTAIAIYDITGKIVFNENNNSNTYFVSLENQPQGMYVALLSYENGTVLTEKLWR